MKLAAAAEKNSEHPLGVAIYTKGKADLGEIPDPRSFEAIPGRGVRAQIDGRQVNLGTRKLITEIGVNTGDAESTIFPGWRTREKQPC